MLHRFTCGLEFVIVPKEIPLSDPEALSVRIVGARSGGRDARVTRTTYPREAAREGFANRPPLNKRRPKAVPYLDRTVGAGKFGHPGIEARDIAQGKPRIASAASWCIHLTLACGVARASGALRATWLRHPCDLTFCR
jgi:hypothetical protein